MIRFDTVQQVAYTVDGEGDFDESEHPRDEQGRFSAAESVKSALVSAKAHYGQETSAGQEYHRFAAAWHEGLTGHLAENEATALNSHMGISGNSIGGIKDELKKQLAIRSEQAARHAVEAARHFAAGDQEKAQAFAESSKRALEIHSSLMNSPKGQAMQRLEKLKASPPKAPKIVTPESYTKYQKQMTTWQNRVGKEQDWYNSLAVSFS